MQFEQHPMLLRVLLDTQVFFLVWRIFLFLGCIINKLFPLFFNRSRITYWSKRTWFTTLVISCTTRY